MTTQELKQQVDKVLGNSIRCLLPSYWWKRLFGLTIDAIEQLPDKEYVDKAVSNVKVVTDTAMSDTSTNAVQNKVIKEYVDAIKPSNRTFYYFETENQELLNHNKKVFQDVLRSAKNGKQIEPVYLGLPTETGERYVIVSPQYSVEEMGSSLLIGFTNVIDHTGEYNYTVFNSGGMLKTTPPADQSTLTFVAAFDTQMNDVTTPQEKSTNISNAQTYYRNIQSGKEYQIDLRVFLRGSSSDIPIKVYPSFIGIAGSYNGVYQSSYGANAMVFANLDIGDRFAGLTFDLILDPDSGFELVPHVDMHKINILHARFKSGAITSEGLTNLQLMQNRTLYKYALSAPVALYVTENRELIPARVSQASGFLAVYAGDYTIEFYDDGTVTAH